MKRIFFTTVILALLLICGGVVKGQNVQVASEGIFRHHELGFSFGAYPIGYDFWRPAYFMGPNYELGLFHYRSFSDDPIQSFQIGAFAIHYQYHINSKHSIGASLSAVMLISDINVAPNYVNHESKHYHGINPYITLIGTYRFTYKSFPKVAFYLGAGLGFTVGVEDKELNEYTRSWWGDSKMTHRYFIGPAAQLTLLGIRLGTTNAANIELGIGTEGVLKIGYNQSF